MNEDLRKRLEEATEKYGFRCHEKIILKVAELCYKEAIEVAKEWLINNVHGNYLYVDGGHVWINNAQLTADFESDMNKLWEGKK